MHDNDFPFTHWTALTKTLVSLTLRHNLTDENTSHFHIRPFDPRFPFNPWPNWHNWWETIPGKLFIFFLNQIARFVALIVPTRALVAELGLGQQGCLVCCSLLKVNKFLSTNYNECMGNHSDWSPAHIRVSSGNYIFSEWKCH